MNKKLLYLGLYASGVITGIGVGMRINRKKLEKEYAAWADAEIKSVKETYKLIRKEPPYDDPKTALAAYNDRISELQYMSENPETVEGVSDEPEYNEEEDAKWAEREAEEENEDQPFRLINPPVEVIDMAVVKEPLPDQGEIVSATPVEDEVEETPPPFSTPDPQEHNAFDNSPTGVIDPPDPDNPYVISVEEFMGNDSGYDQITISYYEEDDTLCDEREQPIPDVEGTVGSGNLQRFGVGSDDVNIVYVRNERLRTDFEICRESGSFVQKVLGISENESRPPKKMKQDE